MADSSPPVDRGEQVDGEYDPWRVPIVVDGAPAEVQGILVYEESVSALPYVGLAIVVGGLLAFYGRRPGLRLAAALLAGGVARRGRRRLGRLLVDARRRREPAALGAGRRRAGDGDRRGRASPTAGSVSCWPSPASPSLSGWALFRIEVLFKPVLPTELPDALDRTVVALALGVSVGAAVIAVLGSGLSLPALADDDPGADGAYSQPIFLKRRQRAKQMTAMTTTTV